MSLKTERMEMTIQREISHILQFELKNPKLGFCTVTDVQCTNDLSQEKAQFVRRIDVKNDNLLVQSAD